MPRLWISEALFLSPLHGPHTEEALVHLLLNPLKTGVIMNYIYIYHYLSKNTVYMYIYIYIPYFSIDNARVIYTKKV